MDDRKSVQSIVPLVQRRTWSPQQARLVLDQWARSGETVTAFARRHGLVPQRLWWWLKRLGPSQPAQPEAPAAQWVPVTVRTAAAPTAAATVHLGSGLQVHLSTLDALSAAWVAHLAQALGARS